MSSNVTAAYGMYPRHVALPEVVGALNQAGFDNADICMVLSPAHPDAAAVSDDAEAKTSATSARTIGWFSGFGAVLIPTVGFFVRSQAFLEALFNEQTPSSMSRGSRTLLGLGFSQNDAERLENHHSRYFSERQSAGIADIEQLDRQLPVDGIYTAGPGSRRAVVP